MEKGTLFPYKTISHNYSKMASKQKIIMLMNINVGKYNIAFAFKDNL